ncbi:hypothetical protein Nepgr_033933 [Nepenthes gracilis]|uniref:Uncharacterized protein n=1 Tax=Nepenthes gracilis TaxID=150966 RepID=A0AAD3TMV1_NEPGR|nr:hypothetical protein Nepgr_033933 [Nepenthes gracilis]
MQDVFRGGSSQSWRDTRPVLGAAWPRASLGGDTRGLGATPEGVFRRDTRGLWRDTGRLRDGTRGAATLAEAGRDNGASLGDTRHLWERPLGFVLGRHSRSLWSDTRGVGEAFLGPPGVFEATLAVLGEAAIRSLGRTLAVFGATRGVLGATLAVLARPRGQSLGDTRGLWRPALGNLGRDTRSLWGIFSGLGRDLRTSLGATPRSLWERHSRSLARHGASLGATLSLVLGATTGVFGAAYSPSLGSTFGRLEAAFPCSHGLGSLAVFEGHCAVFGRSDTSDLQARQGATDRGGDKGRHETGRAAWARRGTCPAGFCAVRRDKGSC